VCAGFITLLVIIYKGYSPSLVRARSQEVLEVVFAGALCYTGLTGASCEVQFLIGLTGGHCQLKFSGTKSLNRPSCLFSPL
jgi:hypothetical protein